MSPTPPKPKDVLLVAAARVSRAAPNAWGEFMDAFNAYARDRMDACVHAPADKILKTQGMAQQCGELQSLLLDAAKQKTGA